MAGVGAEQMTDAQKAPQPTQGSVWESPPRGHPYGRDNSPSSAPNLGPKDVLRK